MQDVHFLIPRSILDIPKITVTRLKIYEAYFVHLTGIGMLLSLDSLAKKSNTSISSVIKAIEFFNSQGVEIKCL